VCRATPYLYSDAEIRALIGAAATLQPQLRAATYQTLISLLAISGIRIGEAIGLDDEDFDTGRALLVVRHGKFGKQRLVPLHPSAVRSAAMLEPVTAQLAVAGNLVTEARGPLRAPLLRVAGQYAQF